MTLGKIGIASRTILLPVLYTCGKATRVTTSVALRMTCRPCRGSSTSEDRKEGVTDYTDHTVIDEAYLFQQLRDGAFWAHFLLCVRPFGDLAAQTRIIFIKYC